MAGFRVAFIAALLPLALVAGPPNLLGERYDGACWDSANCIECVGAGDRDCVQCNGDHFLTYNTATASGEGKGWCQPWSLRQWGNVPFYFTSPEWAAQFHSQQGAWVFTKAERSWTCSRAQTPVAGSPLGNGQFFTGIIIGMQASKNVICTLQADGEEQVQNCTQKNTAIAEKVCFLSQETWENNCGQTGWLACHSSPNDMSCKQGGNWTSQNDVANSAGCVRLCNGLQQLQVLLPRVPSVYPGPLQLCQQPKWFLRARCVELPDGPLALCGSLPTRRVQHGWTRLRKCVQGVQHYSGDG